MSLRVHYPIGGLKELIKNELKYNQTASPLLATIVQVGDISSTATTIDGTGDIHWDRVALQLTEREGKIEFSTTFWNINF